MCSPTNVKEVQRLVGRLTAISKFLPKLAEQTRPIIQLLKKSAKFSWNDDCEKVFQDLKTTLTSPPILRKPDVHLSLLVYITATDYTVSTALVQESAKIQHLVYFVSRTYVHTSKTTISLLKPTTLSRKSSQNLTLPDECHPGPWNFPNSTSATNQTAPSKTNVYLTLSTTSNTPPKMTNGHYTLMVPLIKRRKYRYRPGGPQPHPHRKIPTFRL